MAPTTKSAPTKTETKSAAKVEPATKVEPAKVEPVKVEPAKPAAKVEPAKPAAVQPAPAKIAIVPAGGVAAALDPAPIPEADKKRALELINYSVHYPNPGVIRQKLEKLDPRAVEWALVEHKRTAEATRYQIAKTSQYDLAVLGLVTRNTPPVPAAALPKSAAGKK